MDTTKLAAVEHAEHERSGEHTPINRFSLDTPIEDEGANLSVGQVNISTLMREIVKITHKLWEAVLGISGTSLGERHESVDPR